MIYQKLNFNQIESALKIAGSKPVSLREKNVNQTGFKVFKDKKVFASSYYGQVKDQQKLINQALENHHGALEQSYDFPEKLVKQKKHLSENSKFKDDLFCDYKDALEYLNKSYPNFIFSGDCKYIRTNRSLTTNTGTDLSSEYEMCEWHFIYKDKKSANIIDGYFGQRGIAPKQILEQAKAMDAFFRNYQEVSIAPGDYPVMFISNDVLTNKLEESILIDRYHNRSSLLKGQLGNRVFSDKINLIDTSYRPEVYCFNLFDGDGVVRENPDLSIFEKGNFLSLISNLRLAAKYQEDSTGNELRGYNQSTQLAAHHLHFVPSETAMEDILSDFEKCIIVTLAAGGSFTSSGDFTTPVQQSFLAERGKIVGRLPQLSLSSSFDSMLGTDFIAAASHKTWFPHQESSYLSHNMKVILH